MGLVKRILMGAVTTLVVVIGLLQVTSCEVSDVPAERSAATSYTAPTTQETVSTSVEVITETATEATTEEVTSESVSTTEPTVVATITEPEVAETQPILVQEPEENSEDGTYLGIYEATWYTAVDMGYTSTPIGAAGRSLETAFSVASNSIPFGSYVRIVGGGIDGVYRVDDCGGMADNVIDVYYYDRTSIPNSFKQAGRLNIEVYLIK